MTVESLPAVFAHKEGGGQQTTQGQRLRLQSLNKLDTQGKVDRYFLIFFMNT